MAINDVSLTAGMRSNLLSLQSTVDLLNRTQSRLSSGKKVNSAIDNPTSFFASQALTSRASVIDSLKDGMGQAVQTITAADKGIKAITAMIEQAKGIAQAALSAADGAGLYASETVTLNTVAAGDTIQVGTAVFTAGPSGIGTATTLVSETITFAANADVGDKVDVGGLTFTAVSGSSTAVGTFSLDLNTNTLIAGDNVTVGGVAYTAITSDVSTSYDSYALNLHNTAVGDKVSVGGVQYTAVASTATTTYNHFTVDLTNIVADDSITVAGHTYMATNAAVGAEGAGEFSIAGTDAQAAAKLKALIEADSPATLATSGVTGSSFDITEADGYTLAAGDVSSSRAGAVAADTTVTTDSITATQFRVDTTDALTAANLKASIDAHQAGVFSIAQGAGTNGNNLLTFTGGISDLALDSVTVDVNVGSATLTENTSQVDTTVVGANEFVISGNAGSDATSLRNAINALQGANYTAAGAGSTITIVGDGSTTMGDNSVTVTDGRNVAISTSVATTANGSIGQFEFGVGADNNATAANLAAKLRGYFGSNANTSLNTLNAVNASASNVITITSGTQDLTDTTVQANAADADDDMVIAITSTATDAYAAGYFRVTGDNATDAATIADLINSTAAATTDGFSATADAGVLSIANSEADVAAGDVVVSNATRMAEATVAADTELSALQGQYSEMLRQIDTVAADSGYKGKNLLKGPGEGDLLVVKFEGNHTLQVQGFNATAEGLGINQGVGAEWTAADGDIDADVVKLDNAMNTLRQQASQMSGNLSIITVRQDFSTNMINTLTEGSDKLTLADANEEGANMLMLQTRQSLSTSALSMSAQAAQSVLRLFQ